MININILPPQIKLKIKQAKQSANVFSICLVIIILVSISGLLLSAYKNSLLVPALETAKNQIQQESSGLTSFNELEDKALFLNDRVKIASEVENQKAYWSEIIQNLINSVPTSVQFVSLTSDLTKSPNFILQGNTTSEREAIKFKEKLEDSKFFKDVAFKSSTTSNKEDAEQTLNFTLEFNLENRSNQKATADKEVK